MSKTVRDFLALSRLPDGLPPDRHWLKDVFVESDLHTEEGRKLTGGCDNYNWLVLAAECVNPARIVEFGVRYGYSLACFIGASQQEHLEIFVYDYLEANVDIARANLEKYQPRCVFNWTLSDTKALGHLGMSDIDLCYLDACHEEHGVQMELDSVWPALRPGGIVLVDDVELNNEVHKGIRGWCWREKVAYQIKPSTEGLGVIVKG